MRAYRSLLAGAGARRLALASVLGWLGFGALSLAIVLTVQDATGSASAAGTALAGFALGSGVVRPELLVGEAGAEAIAKARADAA